MRSCPCRDPELEGEHAGQDKDLLQTSSCIFRSCFETHLHPDGLSRSINMWLKWMSCNFCPGRIIKSILYQPGKNIWSSRNLLPCDLGGDGEGGDLIPPLSLSFIFNLLYVINRSFPFFLTRIKECLILLNKMD